MKKSIPIIQEGESDAFIPGNGQEQEFLLSPDIELFNVNLIMMPMPGECIPSQRVNSREWQRIHHHYHLADQAGAVGIKEEKVKAAKKNPGQEMLEKEVMMIVVSSEDTLARVFTCMGWSKAKTAR